MRLNSVSYLLVFVYLLITPYVNAVTSKMVEVTEQELLPLLPKNGIQQYKALLQPRGYQSLTETQFTSNALQDFWKNWAEPVTDSALEYKCSDRDHFYEVSLSQLKELAHFSDEAMVIGSYLIYQDICHNTTIETSKNPQVKVLYRQMMRAKWKVDSIISQHWLVPLGTTIAVLAVIASFLIST